MINLRTVNGASEPLAPLFEDIDQERRTIVGLTRLIEQAVGDGDTTAALLALASLRDLMRRHFGCEEQAMASISGYDVSGHAHEHHALLSGLGALHGAIVAADRPRLGLYVTGFVNRVVRHVIEQDVPFDEDRAAA